MPSTIRAVAAFKDKGLLYLGIGQDSKTPDALHIVEGQVRSGTMSHSRAERECWASTPHDRVSYQGVTIEEGRHDI